MGQNYITNLNKNQQTNETNQLTQDKFKQKENLIQKELSQEEIESYKKQVQDWSM